MLTLNGYGHLVSIEAGPQVYFLRVCVLIYTPFSMYSDSPDAVASDWWSAHDRVPVLDWGCPWDRHGASKLLFAIDLRDAFIKEVTSDELRECWRRRDCVAYSWER